MTTAESPAIRPVTLVDQVVTVIKEQIRTGALSPGDRIVEVPLARKLGVGQNAVREGLIELAHAGYVQRMAGRGTYVTKFSVEEVQKLAAVRRVLEHFAIDLALQRVAQPPAVDFSPVRQILDRMRRAASALDHETFAESDIEFHRHLWALTGNEFLAQSLENLVVPLFVVSILLNLRKSDDPTELLEAVAFHETLTDHVEARSPDSAHAALDAVIEMSLSHYSNHLAATSNS